VAVVSIPFTQALLHAAPLSLSDIGIAFAIGLIPVTLIETEKVIRAWIKRIHASHPERRPAV